MSDKLLVETSERIATVTLNRPDARNALDSELLRLLPEALTALDAADDADVIILTGTDPAFCAGLDLKEMGSTGANLRLGGASGDPVVDDEGRRLRGPFPRLAKPLIAAVNGVAVTGGLEVVLACTFVVASERARFADTHARVGVMPGWGLTVALPQAVGLRRAREMSATGNFVTAHEALAYGLVNHVVAHDTLMTASRALATDIVGNDQRGVRRLLAAYDEAALVTGSEAWDLEASGAREWRHQAFDSAEVERRRAGILARGREQTS